MKTVEISRLYRLSEVGEILALSRSSLYREIEAGSLHAVRIGKALRISAEELARYQASLTANGCVRRPEVA